jgi:acyl-CoA thioester hydrolase
VSELVETYRGAVYPWHCDHMGHMNVMWYVGKFDEATWNLFAGLGLGAAWLREQRRGMVAVDQRLAYQRELVAGDTVVVRSAVLEVGAKTVRFAHRMHDGATDAPCAVCQLVGVHIDAQTRKATALPADIAARARARIATLELPWERAGKA